MKKNWSILIAGALIASAFTVVPAAAAPTIPEEPNIVDIAQDSNGLNDQTTGAGVGGDIATPAYFGGADFLEIWFTNDAETLNTHFHTSGNPSGGNYSYTFRVWANDDCQTFEAHFTGNSNPTRTEDTAQIRDWCDGENLPGEILTEELDDTTFITTVSFPIGSHPAIGMGSKIVGPYAVAHMTNPGVLLPVLDTTAVGTDYEITSTAGSEEPPAAEPGGDDDSPGQGNQKCSKIKDKKKKKACKKNNKGGKGKGPKTPPVDVCQAYVPGEMGAEAETTVVTEQATEEAPIEIEVPLGPAGGAAGPYDTTTRAKHNVQVDVTGAEGGLFAKLESPQGDDPDLYAYWDNGKEAAVAGGFNPLLVAGPWPATPVYSPNGTGSGGHSGFTYEQLDGLRTADCSGYTLDLVNWLGRGGTYKLTLWVGEIQNDPAPRE